MPNTNFSITDNAVNYIKTILNESQVFRITVEPGGCNGFLYKFSIEEFNTEEFNTKEFNIEYCDNDRNNIPIVVIDKNSLEMIGSAVLDYEKELMHEKLVIKNNDYKSGCSCGRSFGI